MEKRLQWCESFRSGACWLVLATCSWMPNGYAQEAATSAAQMVQQLRPARTRSLVVESVPVARPSLSMQIEFDFDSATVRQQSVPSLTQLAEAMQSPELLQTRFLVEGHTDAKGDAAYNRKLSQLRAASVAQWLSAHGVDKGRLQAVGKGADELLNASAPLAAENRRVRIVNVGE